MRHLRLVAASVPLMLAILAAPAGADTIAGTEGSDNGSLPLYPPLYGTSGDDEIHGKRGDDLLFGRGGNDSLDGGPGADALYGEAGDDALGGGVFSRDLLYGGTGNDTYWVYDSDRVRELAGEGTDTVVSVIDYVLPANVENLFLERQAFTGGTWSNPTVFLEPDCASFDDPYPCVQLGSLAIGNGLDNEIRGNFGTVMANRLHGLDGDDLLYGLEGDDDLYGGSGDDVLVGFAVDRQWASLEDDTLTGDGGADRFVIGLSGRAGGLAIPLDRERFPQYLGQGMVYITDFDWQQGDVIEVYGAIDDYWVELRSSTTLGPYAAIYWDGSSAGFGARELVGIALGITEASQIVPALDFR